jgi:hypothetical protein
MKSFNDAIEMLKAAGFEPVEMADRSSRYSWQGWFADVGPETVKFWFPIPGVKPAFEVRAKFRIDTDDAEGIEAILAALETFDDNAENGDNDSEL